MPDPILDATHRRYLLGGEPHIFHCHHYNAFLQQSILDAEFLDTTPFLVGGGHEVAYSQLTDLFRATGTTDVGQRVAIASELYTWAGFGQLDLSGVGEGGGLVRAPSSHYGSAWASKFGRADRPMDLFTTGWLAGALAAIHDAPPDHFDARQTGCVAMGAPEARFEITPTGASFQVFDSPGPGPLGDPPAPVPSPVDDAGIFDAVTGLPFDNDDQGFIPAFGVLLTRHYANYYNRISFELVRALESQFGDAGLEIARSLLVEAGHVCAFNTFGGIMTSTEWDALIRPTLSGRADWVHGMVAVVNALGWGHWQVLDVSDESATFVMTDDYESIGHLAAYGEARYPVAWLAEGAAMGTMDLVYIGDVQSRPTFDVALYERLFRGADAYVAQVVTARAMGHPNTTMQVYRP